MDNKQEVLDFIKANPVCAIATVEGDQPRVRFFLALQFDDGRIYFTTGAGKRVWKQLSNNPKVELSFFAPGFARMLRVTGRIEEVDDRQKKQQLIESQDYLKGFSPDDPMFKLIRVAEGKARFWSLANNMQEDKLTLISL